jgi:ABC-type glycerol-3-phosphate transport system substrate-binding protein
LATLEGYGISSETDHPDACWQWVKYLSQQMPLRSIPIRSVIRESAAYREQVGPEVAAVVQAAMAEDAVLVFVQNQELLARFIQSVVPVLAGQATAQEALLQAQQQSPLK